jgi:hypothetical protein
VRFDSWRRLVVSAVAAAALVALIPLAASASRGYAAESAANTAVASQVTLTVSITGNGGGWVTSNPAGISCGSICSAQFPDGTVVDMGYEPAVGSAFVDWSMTPPYQCLVISKFSDTCEFTLDASLGPASIQATFNSIRPALRCTVPRVEGRILWKAETRIRETHCSVGKVTHTSSREAQKGRVISQKPKAGWQRAQGAKVNLIVGKGRR